MVKNSVQVHQHNEAASNPYQLPVASDTKGEIVLYQPDDTIRLEVRLEGETVWLTQQQMAELFGRDRSVIGKHISNCFRQGELNAEEVCANFAHTTIHGAIEGKVQVHDVTYYNLDVIISVGYRVKSQLGTKFRRHNAQYAPITVYSFNRAHDRFLLIDEEVYHIGASLKDLGKKWFAFTKMNDLTATELINRI